ncbi:MAG: ribosomal-protein-alanine N-acetyltransferase [Planctomycetes bacterium]|nr:ribosomal-protein-alanine N-acetyltransferase [Planctomycetota bacterium]
MSFGQRRSISKNRSDVQIRWMIRRDMPEVLEIERKSFEFAWSEEDFLCCLRQRNCIGMVAERQERIVGFMIYELLKSQLHVLNFAVAPWGRRQGTGSQMMEKLISKLSQQKRQEITLEVRESNLDAQLFFRSQGLQANDVLRGHYEDTDEDAYVMRFQLYPSDNNILPFVPKNRIADLGNEMDSEAA